MKNTLCFILLLLSAFASWAQNKPNRPYMPDNPLLKLLEQDNGFRDAHFGADTTSFQDLVFDVEVTSLSKTYRSYTRANDNKILYGAALADEIRYSFERGKLTSITIELSGKANSRAFFNALYKKYGPGSKRSHSSLGDYWWSTEHVLLSYGEDLKTGKSEVTMISKAGKPKAASDL